MPRLLGVEIEVDASDEDPEVVVVVVLEERGLRALQARTDATQHAGLGLSLSQAPCRHMQMNLAAENVDGGLRFVVTPRE